MIGSRVNRDDSFALGVNSIDLYWLHRDDLNRPVGEMREVVNEQARLGKIRCFGCSNWRPHRIREAQEYASVHQLRPFVSVPILGCVNLDQLHDSLEDVDLTLSPATLTYLLQRLTE